jgi:dienelactone hydrolase
MRGLRNFALVLFIAVGLVHTTRGDSPTTQATRAAFLKVIDRPRVELSAQEQQESAGEFTQIKFSYASEASERVPGILLKSPGETRRPVVIVMHGTGGKKEGEMALLKLFAAKGCIAVAIDGRFHGERGNQTDYNAAITRTFEKGGGHPFYWDTVWDVMRLVDYLQKRDDVDPKRIGLMGISKGGIETYFTAAADERIAVAVPCIGVQSFRWALEHDSWQGRVDTIGKAFRAAAKSAGVEKPDAAFVRSFYDRVVPGINSEFDGPVMLALIAPRPLLMINGDKDNKTPLEGVNLCADAARAAYRAAGAEERFKQIVEPNTGHAVTAEARQELVAWFVRWLKPTADTK